MACGGDQPWWRCSDSGPAGGDGPSGPVPSASGAGTPATLAFTLPTVDGQRFDAATLAGKPVVLWFWAPWCATCAGQAAVVVNAADEYAGRVAFVGIAGMGTEKEMKQFIADLDAGSIPNLNDRSGDVWKRFKVAEQSTFVLLDRAGTVTHRGFLDSVQFGERVAALAG